MKIQPKVELKGIVIELTLEEAEKIARSPKTGADRLQQEIATIVNLNSMPDALLEPPGPHTRIDGTHPASEDKIEKDREKPERIPCEFCGRSYQRRGMKIHLRTCDAAAKAESEARQDLSRAPDPPELGT